MTTPRTGIGVDIHAYGDAFGLHLAGLYWPDERSLSGHSDGDVAAHAACDALLGAAGLGDLGAQFGVDRPELVDAAGVVLLEATARLVREAGFQVGNVSIQIIANRPNLAGRRGEAGQSVTAAHGESSVAASTAALFCTSASVSAAEYIAE